MRPLLLNVTKTFICFGFFWLLGCSISNSQNSESIKIISLLLDKVARPVPPPPPPGLSGELFQIKADSILRVTETKDWMNQKFLVSLDTTMTQLTSPIKISMEGYDELIFKLNSLENTEKININDIIQPRGIILKAEQLGSSGKIDYTGVDMHLSFSKIAFSKNQMKAALLMGVSRGRLNGYASLLILEKVDGKWHIIKDKVLEIS